MIDWEQPANNDFLLVSQFSVTGALYTCRPDLVAFVNGLPLVVIELKKPGVPARAAFDENLTSYKHPQNGIPALFVFNALLIASNGTDIRLLNGTMQVRTLPAAPLPDSVKVARRPVKPRGVGASPTLAANFWKAGRYKLAAPVLKTGSASPRSEHYRRLPPTKPSTKEITMTIITYFPKWLARRFARQRPNRAIRPQLKQRQILPTLPGKQSAPARFQDDDSPPGYRIQWRQ